MEPLLASSESYILQSSRQNVGQCYFQKPLSTSSSPPSSFDFDSFKLVNLCESFAIWFIVNLNWRTDAKVMVINKCDTDRVSPSVSHQSWSCTWNFQSAETKKQKLLNWWLSSILRLETFTGDEKNSVKVSKFFQYS